MIPTAAKNAKGSFEIIQFLTSAEGQAPIADRGQDVPANLELQESDAFLEPEWLETDVSLQAFPDSADMIFTPKFIPEWNEMQKAVTRRDGRVLARRRRGPGHGRRPAGPPRAHHQVLGVIRG